MAICDFLPWRLINPIMHYAWGSRQAIAALRGDAVPSALPEAEMWMGAHPKATSTVLVDGEQVALNGLVKSHPAAILGARVAQRFQNQMPFLFKVLAAAAPLSIQAHPDKQQALNGFARENEMGLALDDPQRNYRDPNHKPEILCALSDFWGLCGFRAPEAIDHLLQRYCPRGYAALAPTRTSDAIDKRLRNLLQALMALPHAQRRLLVDEAQQHAAADCADDATSAWIARLARDYPEDIGSLAPLWLNLFKLAPGEAVFLPAGQLHAYLEGFGIELMANSDNVLRGGLTSKHIDLAELARVLTYRPADPQVRVPLAISAVENFYQTPTEEFALSVLNPAGATTYQAAASRNVEILLVTAGQAEIACSDKMPPLKLRQGDSVLIPAAAPAYRLYGDAQVFKSTVPQG